MTKALWIILAVIVISVITYRLLRRAMIRSHLAWLEQQTPLGAWIASTPEGAITLVFEGEPHGGLYKQLIERNGQRIREFGHWTQHMRRLQMIMMGSDVPNNERIGVDRTYEVRFVAPEKISITGPDRPGVEFSKAPAATVLDFGEPPPHNPPMHRTGPAV